MQIAARVVETALHKLHELDFDVRRVVAGFGSCPLPPVAGDDMEAIGRTNDAMLYGGQVHLTVEADDDDALRELVEQERLCLAAAEALGADYAGVDLLGDHVLELNGIPGWHGLQEATGADVARALVAHLETAVSAA